MAAKFTFEILREANKITDKQERANYLRQNATIALKEMININFNKEIEMMLPEGAPDVVRKETLHDGATLNYEMKKMYLFVKGAGRDDLSPLKRESLWLNLLIALDPEEADDLTKMKDRKLQEKYTNITHEVAHLAFPEFVRPPTNKPARDSKGRFIKKDKKEKA
jgi:hypothetical protein